MFSLFLLDFWVEIVRIAVVVIQIGDKALDFTMQVLQGLDFLEKLLRNNLLVFYEFKVLLKGEGLIAGSWMTPVYHQLTRSRKRAAKSTRFLNFATVVQDVRGDVRHFIKLLTTGAALGQLNTVQESVAFLGF